MMYAYFDAGRGIRETARGIKASTCTVTKYYKIRGKKSKCECGRNLMHVGWCEYRVAHSPNRMAMLERLVTVSPETRSKWRRLKQESDNRLNSELLLAGMVTGFPSPTELRQTELVINKLTRLSREKLPTSTA